MDAGLQRDGDALRQGREAAQHHQLWAPTADRERALPSQQRADKTTLTTETDTGLKTRRETVPPYSEEAGSIGKQSFPCSPPLGMAHRHWGVGSTCFPTSIADLTLWLQHGTAHKPPTHQPHHPQKSSPAVKGARQPTPTCQRPQKAADDPRAVSGSEPNPRSPVRAGGGCVMCRAMPKPCMISLRRDETEKSQSLLHHMPN